MNGCSELALLIGRHLAQDGIHPCAIPRLNLIRASLPTEPLHVVYQPSFCLVAQGGKQVLLGDRRFRYRPGQFLVVSVDLPIVGQVTEADPRTPYLALQLHLDPAMLGGLLLESGLAAQPSLGADCGLLLSDLGPELLDATVRLLRLLDKPADIEVLAPLAEREILYRLLQGEQTRKLRQIALADSRLQRVNRAIGWIKGNFARPFSIGAVAAQAGMSPLQYQKQLRLQEARRLILLRSADAATAGHHVGYDSPSQFSREYRRLFGAPPRQDAARLRAAPGRLLEA